MRKHYVLLWIILIMQVCARGVLVAQTEPVRTVTIDGIIYANDSYNHNWSVKSLADGVIKTHIVIPDSILVDGVKNRVYSVSSGAFEGNTDIQTVILPDSLRFLSSMAFRNCTNLRQINLPRKCTITDRVFENCTSLEEIEIPTGFNLENGSRIFTGCTSLKKVVMKSGYYIGRRFFYGCTSLEELILPSSIEEIGAEAFAGCNNLKKITISHTGTSNYLYLSVGEGAFPDMTLLEKAVADAAAHESLKTNDIISGVVRDADGNPINMAYVKEIDSEGRIFDDDLTASNGKFSFRLNNPANRIEFYSMGYETVNLPLNTAYYLINLTEKPDTAVYKPSRKKQSSKSHRGHEYVDLGLSVKWATCNIGSETPDNPGDLYVWDSEDDVAHVKWGGRWRMPTADEFRELCLSCNWTWTTCNNVYGYRITSRMPGYEECSIFLPVCDDYSGSFPFYMGPNGQYLSSSLSSDDPSSCCTLMFNSENVNWGFYSRNFTRSVRPVCP